MIHDIIIYPNQVNMITLDKLKFSLIKSHKIYGKLSWEIINAFNVDYLSHVCSTISTCQLPSCPDLIFSSSL